MNLDLQRHARLLLLAAGVIAAVLAGRAVRVLSLAAVPTAAEWPNPEELDSLRTYVRPVSPPASFGTGFGLEPERFADPFAPRRVVPAPAPQPTVVAAPEPERPSWRVSAILISDTRRVAVINNALFTLGDQLPGGARVAAIEKDRVVVVQSNGLRRSLPVESGGEYES